MGIKRVLKPGIKILKMAIGHPATLPTSDPWPATLAGLSSKRKTLLYVPPVVCLDYTALENFTYDKY